jgi:hypothetical protein
LKTPILEPKTACHARLQRYQSFVATVESGRRCIDVIEFLDLTEAIGFDPIDAIENASRLGSFSVIARLTSLPGSRTNPVPRKRIGGYKPFES